KPETEDANTLKTRIHDQIAKYRVEYTNYYDSFATNDSPKLRDTNPSVVLIPGLGLFGFGKNKKEARITTEFFINAIHVIAGANDLEGGSSTDRLLPGRTAEQSKEVTQF